jgi:DNA topoisomerase-6 subunit B
MPEPAKEMKHHPSSVNDLLLRQLIDQKPSLTMKKFLSTQLSCINPALASRLIGL